MCFLSTSGSATSIELVTCISRLVPRYFSFFFFFLHADCFLPPLLAPLIFFFLHSAHVFVFHGFVCLRSQWMEITDSGRCSQEQGCSLPFFVQPPPVPFFPLCWNAAGGHARGFQTSVCVGGPWRVTHHNSRVEWAGQRRGEKINSVRRGFPN